MNQELSVENVVDKIILEQIDTQDNKMYVLFVVFKDDLNKLHKGFSCLQLYLQFTNNFSEQTADMLIDVSSFLDTPMKGHSPKIFTKTILLTNTVLMIIKKQCWVIKLNYTFKIAENTYSSSLCQLRLLKVQDLFLWLKYTNNSILLQRIKFYSNITIIYITNDQFFGVQLFKLKQRLY